MKSNLERKTPDVHPVDEVVAVNPTPMQKFLSGTNLRCAESVSGVTMDSTHTGQSTTTGANVCGGYTYVPPAYPMPYIGDPIWSPGTGDWQPGTTGPNTYPGVYPNVLPYNSLFMSQLNWGVQRQTEPEKGGDEYQVVSPFTFLTLPPTAKIVAYTPTEEDATAVAVALNRATPASATCSVSEIGEDNKSLEGTKHSYSFIATTIKDLAGKVLTVVDAAYTSEAQCRAIKTLIRREIRSALDRVWKLCYTDARDEEGVEETSETL